MRMGDSFFAEVVYSGAQEYLGRDSVERTDAAPGDLFPPAPASRTVSRY